MSGTQDDDGGSGRTAAAAPERVALEARVLAEQEAVQHLALRSVLDDLLTLPLTIVQLKCLLVVLADGASTGGALCTRLGLSAPTVSGVVDRLVEAGYLQRRPDPDDRRVVRLDPTPRTLEWADGMARSFQARSAEVTAQLSDSELRHLAIGTAAVRRVLERQIPLPEHPSTTRHPGGTP